MKIQAPESHRALVRLVAEISSAPGSATAAHFSRSREADPGRLHFAAHSHHPWPDTTQAAHAAYWLDAAQLLDRVAGRERVRSQVGAFGIHVFALPQ